MSDLKQTAYNNRKINYKIVYSKIIEHFKIKLHFFNFILIAKTWKSIESRLNVESLTRRVKK